MNNRLNNFFGMAMLPKVFFRCEAQKPGISDLRQTTNWRLRKSKTLP
jgi:hypothetical protein